MTRRGWPSVESSSECRSLHELLDLQRVSARVWEPEHVPGARHNDFFGTPDALQKN